jgi:iron complex transport system substrate-binding protein
MKRYPPERIVCLTEETVETLYLLGEQERIVGVTGFAVRPPEVRREKPRVGAFTSADVPGIKALAPDLVLTFSDLQAPIADALIREGIAVHAFNQRSIAGILAMIRTVGALVGVPGKAEALAQELEARVARTRQQCRSATPVRVYFEEWDDPLITGIGWVSELIGVAGGRDVFAEAGREQAAGGRIVSSASVIEAAPEVIVASWCGKKLRPERIAARSGWDAIPAVQSGQLHEIKSPLILQPGPAALTDGLDALVAAFQGAEALDASVEGGGAEHGAATPGHERPQARDGGGGSRS